MKKLFFALALSLFATSVFAQAPISGTWDTGKDSTFVRIHEQDGSFIGEIVSSANPKAQIGRRLLKDLKNEAGVWRGKLFAPKRDEWFEAEIVVRENILKITVSAGFRSRTIEWQRVNDEPQEGTESEAEANNPNADKLSD